MVKLRLTRMGRKKRPFYRIVAVDSRVRRDGAFIDRIGYYHPLDDPPSISIDGEKALKWLRVGAQPSDTVRSLLRKEGVWLRFRLEKRKLPEAQIDEMMVEWMARQAVKKATPVQVAQPAAPASEPTVEEPAPAEAPVVTEEPTPVETPPVVEEAPAVTEVAAVEPETKAGTEE